MIALDVESSGLDPKTASIVSLGAVDTDDPTNQFYDECRVWDGASVSDEALAVNGFSREEIAPDATGKKSEAELIVAFVAWAMDLPKNRTLVAQTPAFDRDFVAAACARADISFPFAHRTLDTHTLCWMHMVKRGVEPPTAHQRTAINLDYVLEYCGLPGEPKPHNALTGALCHAESFARLAYNQKLIPDFASFNIPWNHDASQMS